VLISTGDTPEPPDLPNGEANDQHSPSPKSPLETPVPLTADEVKEQGNEAFKSKNYTKAVDLYSQAIGEWHSTI
jgi:DnaJ family protein C protein 7